MRHSLGSASLVVGCSLYACSNVIGHGWSIAPYPVYALLFSALGMMLCVLSVLVAPQCSVAELVSFMKAVFFLGSFSLLATLCMAVAHPFLDLDNQNWGAIPPPGLIFGTMYGAISVMAVLGIQVWEQQTGTMTEHVR